jgi:hypothetical protein
VSHQRCGRWQRPLGGLKENVIIGRLIPAGTGYRSMSTKVILLRVETQKYLLQRGIFVL